MAAAHHKTRHEGADALLTGFFQMREHETTKISDNLASFEPSIAAFAEPAERAFRSLPPLAAAIAAVLALRVPIAVNGVGSAAIDKLLRSNAPSSRVALLASFGATYHYLRKLACEDLPKLEGIEQNEMPRQVATSIRRLPPAFWLSAIVSGSTAFHAIKVLCAFLFNKLMRLRPGVAVPVALALTVIAKRFSANRTQVESADQLSRKSTVAVLSDIRAVGTGANRWPSLKEYYFSIYQAHAATLIPISVAFGVVPPAAVTAGAVIVGRSLVSLNSLSEALIGGLLHTPGIVARTALAAALLPGWAAAFRHRNELMQYWKQITQTVQDDESLRGLVHDVHALPPRFWMALCLSAALTLQAAQDAGVGAVGKLMRMKQNWPAAALFCIAGALVTSVVPVPAPRGQGDDVVSEASNFVQRLGDRLTPLVVAVCEMQPVAAASVSAVVIRLCLNANGFTELAVGEVLKSSPLVAMVAFWTSLVPAWVARNHYKNANASPDDAAQRASRVSSVFWLIALLSGFVTLQAVREIGSRSVRKML